MTVPFKNILGVHISAINYHSCLRLIESVIALRKKGYICVAAVHLVVECQNNPKLLDGVNKATLVTPDGMPLVWLLKLHGCKHVERVYGPTLMLKLCSLAQSNNWKVFLLGGSLGQGAAMISRLALLFPKLRIIGSLDTPVKIFSKKKNGQIINQINKHKPHVVFVGLGCPHQELWMINNHNKINANTLIGVGAAFNLLAGVEKQAHPQAQRLGLEWLYRLYQNPRRLWYRYAVGNIHFMLAILIKPFWQKLRHGLRDYSPFFDR